MGFKYKIVTDSSVDMMPSFADENEISIIPMSYIIGEDEFNCDHVETDEERARFYKAQRDGKETKTSQTSPQSCIDVFTEYAKQGIDVLCLSLDSGISGSFNSASMAAQVVMDDYPGVKIMAVDTLAATAGIGLLLEYAAMNRANGMTIEENAAWINENKLRVQHWFMVDDLMYLKKGGRIPATTAIIGTALNIKPILKIEADGKLSNFAKKRGAKLAMSTLVSYYANESSKENGEIVYLIHSDSPESARYLEAEAKKINPGCVTRTVQLSPVIGAHTGPGMCAIVYLSSMDDARK